MLSVISYNIHLGKRIERIISWYITHAHNYDVMCFQEYPERKISRLLTKLGSDFDFRFAPGIKIKRNMYGQLTVFNSKKIELLKSSIVNLGASRIERLYNKNDAERSALFTTFKNDSKLPFLLINCHLTPFTHNGRRLKQLQLIIDQIGADERALIVGDYNYPSIRQRRLIDFMKANNFENGSKNIKTHKLLFMKHQMDYIFQRNCKVKGIATKNLKFSDHIPLIARCDL